MIGPRPNPAVIATDCPVEYSDGGTIRPITTTVVVNSSANPAPSNNVSAETMRGFETSPQSRNPEAYTTHPATNTLRRSNLRCSRGDTRIVGTSTSPPSAVPSPISNGPPPAASILSPMKFHAALNPVQSSSSATRNTQNRGTVRNSVPTVPSRPCSPRTW